MKKRLKNESPKKHPKDTQNDPPGTYFWGPQKRQIGSRGLPRAPGATPEKTKFFERVPGPPKNRKIAQNPSTSNPLHWAPDGNQTQKLSIRLEM